MNCKAKGTANEHRSRKLLEAVGYSVIRAGASLGVFDLIAVGSHDVIGVQVKTGRLPSPAERESMRLFVGPPNFKRLIHVWYPRQRQPRVEEVL